MQLDFYEKLSAAHASRLADQNFTDIEQLFAGPEPKTPRLRTFWKARRAGTDVFVKVNHGFSDAENRDFMVKEMRLTEYFTEQFRDLPGVRIPRALDLWSLDEGSFGIFEWHTMGEQGLEHCFASPERTQIWMRMVSVLRDLRPPDWWGPDRFNWMTYAGEQAVAPMAAESPFSIDFDNNVSFDERGLILFDFEHTEWAPRGLLEGYIALKAFCGSRNHYARALIGKGPAHKLLKEVAPLDSAVIDHAQRIYTALLERRKLMSPRARVRLFAGKALLKLKA